MDDPLGASFAGENAATGSVNNNDNNNTHTHQSVEECTPIETEEVAINEPLTGYFIASKDGENFIVIHTSSLSEALSQGFYVYYVEEPLVDFTTTVSSAAVDASTVNVHNQSEPFVLRDSCADLLRFDQNDSLTNKLVNDDDGVGQTVTFTDNLSEQQPNLLQQKQPSSLLSDPANVGKGTVSELAAGRSHVPSQNFECTVCRRVLKNKRELRQHIRNHEEEKPHVCSHCPVAFNHPENLKLHVALSHTVTEQMAPPYACPLCNVQLSRYTAFRSHLLLHQVDENLMCHLCHRLFPSYSLLDAHQAAEHTSDAQEGKCLTQYRCHLCQTIIFSSGNLYKHYRSKHPNEIRSKRQIPVVSSSSTDSTHMTSESPGIPQTTPERGVRKSKLRAKAYLASLKLTAGLRKKTDQDSAYDHMIGIVNSTESVSKEPDCSVEKNNSQEPGTTGAKTNLRACPICKKRFPKPCLVRRHMLQHTQTKPFECLLCHARFVQKSSARAHVVTHSNAALLFCPFCSRHFARKHNLIAHIDRAHSDVSVRFVDEPAEEVCEQLSTETSQCNTFGYSHVIYACPQSSTGPAERLFVAPQPLCTVERPASNQASYTTQLPEPSEVIELGPEPVLTGARLSRLFVCHVCQKAFSSSRTLSVHLLRHSSAPLPYTCSQCSRRFASRSHQRYHINTHHVRECKQKARSDWLSHCKSLQRNTGGPLKWNSVRRRFQYTTRTVQRPHQCGQCEKTYRHLNHLRAHIRHQHNTAMAPFACTVCTRRFVTAGALGRHVARGHQRLAVVPRAVCPVCELSFSNANSMKRHLAVHSTERPYRCAWCQKSFKFHSSCSKHMKTRVCQSRLVSMEAANAVALGFTEQPGFDVLTSTNYGHGLVSGVPSSESAPQFPLSSTVLLPDPNNPWPNSANFPINHSTWSNTNEQFGLSNRFWSVPTSSSRNNDNHTAGLIDTTGVYAAKNLIPTRYQYPFPFSTSCSSSTGEKLGVDSASNTEQGFPATINWTNETAVPVLLNPETALNANSFQMESFSTVVQAPTTLQPNIVCLRPVYSCANASILAEPIGTHGYTNLLMGSEYPRDSVQIFNSLDPETTSWYATSADKVTTESSYRQLMEPASFTEVPPPDKTCAGIINESIVESALDQVVYEDTHSQHLNAKHSVPEHHQQQQHDDTPPSLLSSVPHGQEIVQNTTVQPSDLDPEVYCDAPPEITERLSPSMNPEPTFGCALCSASFVDTDDLLIHSETAHPYQEQSRVVCQLCDRPFSNETLLLAHYQSHKKPTPCTILCPICPAARFSSQSGLTRHINCCHPAPDSHRFQCRNCGTRFIQLRALRSHVASRNQCIRDASSVDGGRRANGTGKQSMQPRRHYRGVQLPALKTSDLRSWAQMKPSDEMTLSEKYLIKAAGEFLNESDQTPVNQPEDVPTQAAAVEQIEAADSQSKRHLCPVCAQPFRLVSDLKRHMCRHTGDRPFKCTECDKQYIKHNQLRQHQLKAHSSSIAHEVISSAQSSSCRAQFMCHICHRVYGGKFSLLRHVRLHATRRRFACPHCHRKFTTLSRKRSHTSRCLAAQDLADFPIHTGSAVTAANNGLPAGPEPSFLEQLNTDSVDGESESVGNTRIAPDTVVTVVDLDQGLSGHDAEEDVNVGQPILLNENFIVTSHSIVWNDDNVSLSIPEVANRYTSDVTDFPIGPIDMTATRPNTSNCVVDSVSENDLPRSREAHSVDALSNGASHPATGYTELTRCETCQREFSHSASYRKHNCYPNPGTSNDQQCYSALKHPKPNGTVAGQHTASSSRTKRSAFNKRVPVSASCVLQPLHKCGHCDRVFHHVNSLKRHEAAIHEGGKLTYSCETCGDTFTKRSSLANHELIHQGVKPFRCSRCAMKFRQRSNLRRHFKALHS